MLARCGETGTLGPVGSIANWCIHYGKEHSFSKFKNRNIIFSINPTFRNILKRIESKVSKKCSHTHVYNNTFHSSQELKQSKYVLTDKWLKKMWYIHIAEYYSSLKGKEILSHSAIGMNLEDTMLCEISQL